MIKAFTVRNFKAIGEEPVRIELKPITLLFGANSAGKSSILHALQYAYEVFNNRNLNPNINTLDDNSLDLGGFDNFIHGNDINRSILMRFDFDYDYHSDCPGCIKTRHYAVYGGSEIFSKFRDIFSGEILHYTFLSLNKLRNFYVEIEIAWSHENKKPYLRRYETGFNDERMATIGFDVYNKKMILQYLNIDHPIFFNLWQDQGVSVGFLIKESIKEIYYRINSSPDKEINNINDVIEKESREIREKISKGEIGFIEWLEWDEESKEHRKSINADHDHDHDYQEIGHMMSVREQLFNNYGGRIPPNTPILASGEDNLNIILEFDTLPPYWDRPLYIDPTCTNSSGEELHHLSSLLILVLLAPGAHVADFLHKRHHLGPLRDIPPRHFSGLDPTDKTKRLRWEKGLAAWDILYWIGQQKLDESEKIIEGTTEQRSDFREYAIKLLDKINDWLSSDQRLNTGYWIDIQYYREIYREHFNALANSKSLEELNNNINKIRSFHEKIRIRLKDKARPNLNLTPHEIGVGISQVLPVVVAAVGLNAQLIAFEQPELHIHPAIQVQLGDLFISQSSDKKFFLVETHSEHLLLRILRRIRETSEGQTSNEFKVQPNNIAIYYVESENGKTEVNRIGLDENGRFTDRWPKGFFAERMQEMLPSDIRDRVESKERGKK